MVFVIGPLKLIRKTLHLLLGEERGDSALESGMVVGAAVAAGVVFAAGATSTGTDAAKGAASNMSEGVEAAKATLELKGDILLLGGTSVDAVNPITIVQDNLPVIIPANQTTFTAQDVLFTITTSGSPIDLSNLVVGYSDATQAAQANDLSDVVVGDDTATYGAVSFRWINGSPGTAGSKPSVKKGELVEVSIDLSGLQNLLAANSNFTLEFVPNVGVPFKVSGRTPASLKANQVIK